MSLSLEDNRALLMLEIAGLIDKRLSAAEAQLVKDFLDQYYLGVSLDDLRDKNILDLYGSLMSQWNFIKKKAPGESKIRAYNPQQEQNGWQSVHTVIEIVNENKPFLLDTVRLALHRLDLNIHFIIDAEGINFTRNEKNIIKKIQPQSYSGNHVSETVIYIEINKQSDQGMLDKIVEKISMALFDVDLMVRDWKKMLSRLSNTVNILENNQNPQQQNLMLEEVIAFLHWLKDNNFTFIGSAEYTFSYDNQGGGFLHYIDDSGLGVLSEERIHNTVRDINKMYPEAKKMILSDEVMLVGKTDTLSTVHRPAYTDFVAIKFFNEKGELVSAIRFIGLYTATAYNNQAQNIPFVRKKVERIFSMSEFSKASHDGRELLHILENLPRDDLFHARDHELLDFAMGIFHLQERKKIRVFIRRDIYGRYFSCLVFVPREMFNSELRNEMQAILLQELDGVSVSFDTKFSESILARIHFMIRLESIKEITYNVDAIEKKLSQAARSWSDDLYDVLNDSFGEEHANELFKLYGESFPLSYKEMFSAQAAVVDIQHIQNLKKQDEEYLEMRLYRPLEDNEDSFRFKIFRKDITIPLSDIIPILEKMGLRIISERSHEIKIQDNGSVWINDYSMVHPGGEKLDPNLVKDIFQEAFAAVWHDVCENDGFNKLVLSAELAWRDISILRAYYRFMWQTGLAFSQNYVEDAMNNNSDLAKKLIEYFYIKFEPGPHNPDKIAELAAIKNGIERELENVSSLNEDRIIRHYLMILEATVRTNFFQKNSHGDVKSYCAYKMDSAKIPELPLPKPLCEIFVYSPQVEAVHLRGDRVARGGIRWSDRHEDFRTEVLGLMKAQQVKNAVIVPLGAKGGFVVKRDLQTIDSREEKMKVVTSCYRTFIRGLLDLTDNNKGTQILKPENTVCWDEDDTYLVVAADKGTATFSDMANQLSQDYDFWLGDAFASGGSAGYDHKKLAITARGAWESVKMHFKYLGIDLQKQAVTVIGIGDMAGDVFGNGMLLSNSLKLIAAFNHVHIFFDPNPDPKTSFEERQRLFDLPGSGWNNYNPELISQGGGVFDRAAKKITLSPEMKQILNCEDEALQPNDLIRDILMLQVDLLYNGGIGTFVKAHSERNADVGDRVNDAIRINGSDLRVSVVCEGGNLGFTQLARIEYAKAGGIINTDAIDNSAGVNCSDNEVNIKILLNEVVAEGDMTEKQRNELLSSMGSEVAELVLANNLKQNEAITLTVAQAAANLQMHDRLLKELERSAGLDPIVEFLPNAEEIAVRAGAQQGFMRPEIAILMAYTKIFIKKKLIESTVPDEPYTNNFFISYFPQALHAQKYAKYLQTHRLKRAIIATELSNHIVDEMGINFIQRLEEESGCSTAEITCAYMVVREIFDAANVRLEIRSLPCEVSTESRLTIIQNFNRLLRRSTRWFLRNGTGNLQIEATITQFKPMVTELQQKIQGVLHGAWLENVDAEREHLLQSGVPLDLAKKASTFYSMFTAMDIIAAALENNSDIMAVAEVYFAIGDRLNIGWFGEMINKQPVHNNWEALARASFRDDIDKQQRNLAISILNSHNNSNMDLENRINNWLSKHEPLLKRWESVVVELKSSTPEFTMFAVALKELLNLSAASN